MTKTNSFFLATAFFVSSVVPALANNDNLEPTRTASRQEFKTIINNFVKDIKDIRINTREEIKEIKTESRAEIKEARTTAIEQRKENREMLKATTTQSRLELNKKRITAVYQGLFNAFNRRLDVLQSYQSRVQTKLNEKKVDLPNSQNLTDAQLKLNNVTNTLIPKYNSDLSSFKAKTDLVANSSDPKSLVPELKSLAKVVEQDLRSIRIDLVEALRLIVKAK